MRFTRVSSALLLSIFISEFHGPNGLPTSTTSENSTHSSNANGSQSEPGEGFYREIRKNELGIRAIGVVGKNENMKKDSMFGSPEACLAKEIDQMFQNIKTILEKYGTTFKRVATYIFYVDHKDHFKVIEKTLRNYTDHLPGRQMIMSENLPKGTHIECEFVAFTTNKTLDPQTCMNMEIP